MSAPQPSGSAVAGMAGAVESSPLRVVRVIDGDTLHVMGAIPPDHPVPIPVRLQDPRTGREFTQVQNVEVEINPELLAEISRTTGGTSFRARDAAALADVFDEIDRMERDGCDIVGMTGMPETSLARELGLC